MMIEYSNLDIQELPLSVPFFRRKVESFLEGNGLRLETLDCYYTLQNADGKILAGAGLKADVIKGLAVASEARSEGLVSPLLSHIVSVAASRGITCLKVFTKPVYQALFESLGFHLLASASEAILLENGRGLEQYCRYLGGFRRPGTTGVVVMNANPFTLGHRYLLEQALSKVDNLVVIPVHEDVSQFRYSERVQMIREGAPEGVFVAEGSDYQISALTFPTYFLKDLSTAAETQMRLDADLFVRHIAPALGASVRFVGTEPSDALTARYNEILKERFQVVEIPRLETDGTSVSASSVRSFLSLGRYAGAAALVPASSRPYLLAQLAVSALQKELDCPLKPGLVGPDSSGSHSDMDYALMQRSISALRPWFVRMAMASSARKLQEMGLMAEKAMLEATGGVNTHKGAIYCLGLALYACGAELPETETDLQNRLAQIAQSISSKDNALSPTHGELAVKQYGVKGARALAQGGYQEVFTLWLPYYRNEAALSGATLCDPYRVPESTSSFRLQKTLLYIISTLDDTCIIHRVGYSRAREVKREAGELLRNFSEEGLRALCLQYVSEGISPGGAADMLALTLFMNAITTH